MKNYDGRLHTGIGTYDGGRSFVFFTPLLPVAGPLAAAAAGGMLLSVPNRDSVSRMRLTKSKSSREANIVFYYLKYLYVDAHQLTYRCFGRPQYRGEKNEGDEIAVHFDCAG